MNSKGKILCFAPRASQRFWGGEPFQLLAATSMLVEDGYEVKIILSMRGKDFESEIKKEAPGCLAFGVSVMTGFPIAEAIQASKVFKSVNQSAPVIWGGWHPSILPEQILEKSYVDIVVMGQGERAFLEIMQRISADKKFEGILSVVYRDNNRIVKNEPRPLENVNHFPALPYHIVNLQDFILPTFLGSRTVRYASSQGCPHRCGFCVDPMVYGRRWFGLYPERVVEDIELLIKNYGINGIIFTDSNFFTDLGRAVDIAMLLLKKGIKIKWGQVNGRTRQLLRYSEKEWQLLKLSGLQNILVGAESGLQQGLDLIEKDTTIEDTLSLGEISNRVGITVNFSMMVGLPYGIGDLRSQAKMVKEEFRQILKMVKNIYEQHNTRNSIQLFVYTPYPGTPLYQKSLHLGVTEPKHLEDWVNFELGRKNTPWVSQNIVRKVSMLNDYIFRWIEDEWFTKLRAIKSPLRPLLLLGGHFLKLLAKLRWRFKFFGLSLDYFLVKAATSRVMMMHVKK